MFLAVAFVFLFADGRHSRPSLAPCRPTSDNLRPFISRQLKSLEEVDPLSEPQGKSFPIGEVLLTLGLAVPVLLVYNLLLIERKYSVLLGKQQFLVAEPLSPIAKILFLIVYGAGVTVVLLSAVVLSLALFRGLRDRWRRFPRLVCGVVACVWFAVITFQFQVARYFRDGLNLALAKKLGGGSLEAAVGYVRDELLGMLPLFLAGIVGFVVLAMILRRFGGRLARKIDGSPFAARLVRPKFLVVANLAMLLVAAAVAWFAPPLDRALYTSMAHRIYRIPLDTLTDFDFDGYGLMSRPRDHAPFDGDRHPFALEVPGNDVDENGIGGDLAQTTWSVPARPWDASRLEHRNVLVIVLESARADLIDARLRDEWVMPTLRAAPGHRLDVFSHVAFSTPSVVSILCGGVSSLEGHTDRPLIERFRDMGYRTGVFSGQAESFGRKAELAGMTSADTFRDSATEPEDARMYPSTLPASLKMPAPIMNARFFEWLDGSDRAQPFFAYVNWQEMHFPYTFESAGAPLEKHPIPRGEISAGNRDWLMRTYYNAARLADDALASVLEELEHRKLRGDTTVLVVGDHGEELFDLGSLGHGTVLSFEQNQTLAKILDPATPKPNGPIGVGDVPILLHNRLARDPAHHLPYLDPVLCYVGGVFTPFEVGIVTAEEGLVKYDFLREQWSRQASFGAPFEAVDERLDIIHLWESYLVQYPTGR